MSKGPDFLPDELPPRDGMKTLHDVSASFSIDAARSTTLLRCGSDGIDGVKIVG